jgi:hypothetical protein
MPTPMTTCNFAQPKAVLRTPTITPLPTEEDCLALLRRLLTEPGIPPLQNTPLEGFLMAMDSLGATGFQDWLDSPVGTRGYCYHTADGQRFIVVQYPEFDSPFAGVRYGLACWPADQPVPCLVATVQDRGTIQGLWPSSVVTSVVTAPRLRRMHYVCMTHDRTVSMN